MRAIFRIILLLITLSAILCHKGFAQDHPAIDSLKQLILQSKQDTSHVNLLLELGNLFDHFIPDTAFLYYHKALEIAEELDYKWGKAEGIRSIGLIHQLQGKNDGKS